MGKTETFEKGVPCKMSGTLMDIHLVAAEEQL